MEHIRHSTPRRNRINRDFLQPSIFSHDTHERLDRALGARVERVLRDGEGVGCVGGHEDDAAARVEVAVGFAGDEELGPRVDAEDAIEFLLYVRESQPLA